MDGMNSPEGLVVVLTCNYPGNLDRALTRAGRTDVKGFLGPPSKRQIMAIFTKAYAKEQNVSRKIDEARLSYDVVDLASQFACKADGCGYTVADIQGYLLEWNDKPDKAVENIDLLSRNR